MAPPSPSRATVAALLTPAERHRVEAAGEGCFTLVHQETVGATMQLVRERGADAILVSVHCCEPQAIPTVGRMVREFPSIPTVALVSRYDARATDALLQLGASGVRHVVDVTAPQGWRTLRDALARPASRAEARLQGPILASLDGLPPDTRMFVELLVRCAPDTPTVRDLAARLHIRPSTLMSRFSRAGLPSAKSYLAGIRLLHAALLFEDRGLTIADVAYRLDYSSAQSFGRHVRATLGITASEFRHRLTAAEALARFDAALLAPYRDRWRSFHPLGGNLPVMS